MHSSEKQLAKDLARQSNGKYTVEQIEEQMRLMGHQALGVAPNTVEALTSPEAIAQNLLTDPNMPKIVEGSVVMERPGQANTEIQQFILLNTTDNVATWIPGSSPYQPSRTDVAPAPAAGPVVPSAPTTASCGNMDLDCKAGLNPQQSLDLPQMSQAVRETIADGAATTSRAAGVVGAAATAAASQSGPYGRPAQALATGATAVGLAADAVEQAVRPDVGKVTQTFFSNLVQYHIDQKLPLAAPITNEVIQLWRASGTSLSIEAWANEQWSKAVNSKKRSP